MAGYNGFSMSNNAVMAYESGEKPISKWTKSEILNIVYELFGSGEVEVNFDISLLKKVKVKVLKENLLTYSSWHHTSSHFNKTDFYSIDMDRLSELTDDDILKMAEVVEEVPTDIKPELWKCTFLEWSGTRKHPKATEVTEVGEVKGDWFFRSNGTKKKTTANGFKFVEKIEA